MKKALFIALWVCVGITAVAQVTLTFNPEQGAKYEYQIEMIQKIKQDIMGQSIEVNQTMVMAYEMDILENSASEVKTEMMYSGILFNMTSAMMNMKYDSKNPGSSSGPMDATMEKIMGSMLNKKFQVVFGHDGSVKSVTGMKAIIDDMLASLGTDMMTAQVGQQMAQQFGDEALEKGFEQFFKTYPGKAINVGESWTIEQNTASMGVDMDIKTVYALKSVDNEKAYVDVKSIISGFNGQLKGDQSGATEYDLASGFPVSSKVDQTIKGTVSANGMEIPMDVVSATNITIRKLN
ncbi:DUF6263 family protein [Bacteroides sp. OttesenSCG-928-E20]|nr:DUF6263 family protein [Bacteroides sp. OttesenSCG-928-N06]MDL2299148.1 DUF6263 family protein [Bacteroides sp. OttesenSCG-928-E20]MDL2305806.1 DUF6263 family protein [Bacteroides sp. OttesenSCG-928-D19]